jgi:hypothetical protein
MVSLAEDLKLAVNRAAFARSLGMEPDPWQERLLRSGSARILLNCSRQSGKSTMSAVIALRQRRLILDQQSQRSSPGTRAKAGSVHVARNGS